MSEPAILTVPGLGNASPGMWMSLWEAERPAWRRVVQSDAGLSRRHPVHARLRSAIAPFPSDRDQPLRRIATAELAAIVPDAAKATQELNDRRAHGLRHARPAQRVERKVELVATTARLGL